ncbi:hypothetical protein [Acaryochloris thomasi]|uniref:hypothetical protein n=1 Tax=Acaryochloris thomasi TaxID=2929456 RepID=UPI0011B5B049|nr:hypothetical protein [Acaryochloris thomasi]
MQTAAQQLQVSSDTASIHPKQVEDPLIGLFDGSPELATRSEEMLAQNVRPASGFTRKASLQIAALLLP